MLQDKLGYLIDKLLLKFVLLNLMLLIFCQLALMAPDVGQRLNTALRLEGEPLGHNKLVDYAGGVTTAPWATVTLKLLTYVSLPEVKVLIDGKEIGHFLRNEVAITVKDGDIISIYNPNPYMPVTVIVNKKTANVLEPSKNQGVEGTGTLYLNPVVIK